MRRPATKEPEIEFGKAAQMLYAESGVTTADEGATHATDLEAMERATAAGADVIACPSITDLVILDRNPLKEGRTIYARP